MKLNLLQVHLPEYLNLQIRNLLKNFELAGKDNYGTLQLKVITPEEPNQYILEVIDENKTSGQHQYFSRKIPR